MGQQRFAIRPTLFTLPSGPPNIGCPIIAAQTKKRVKAVEVLKLFNLPNNNTVNGKKGKIPSKRNLVSFST